MSFLGKTVFRDCPGFKLKGRRGESALATRIVKQELILTISPSERNGIGLARLIEIVIAAEKPAAGVSRADVVICLLQ